MLLSQPTRSFNTNFFVDRAAPFTYTGHMPGKLSRKIYIKDGRYHVFNRGVEKRKIFLDDQDYTVFLHLLKYYLCPSEQPSVHPLSEFTSLKLVRPKPLNTLENKLDLLAFCLMPNHFHLLVKQKTVDGMPKLLSKLSTTYSMYFNKRYDRVGYLFQGRYKAAMITEDNYLLHLSRYIHLNPSELTGPHPLHNYPYSSYQYYLGLKKADWIKPDFILNYFDKSKVLPEFINEFPNHPTYSYQKFVEEYNKDPKDQIGTLSID